MPTDCAHLERTDDGRCAACGTCLHEVVLNGACLYCGETDLAPARRGGHGELVPPGRLVAGRRNRE